MYAVRPSAEAATSCGSGPDGTFPTILSDTGSMTDKVRSPFDSTSSRPCGVLWPCTPVSPMFRIRSARMAMRARGFGSIWTSWTFGLRLLHASVYSRAFSHRRETADVYYTELHQEAPMATTRL